MIKITEETYHEMVEESGGYCLACKLEAYGVEPDARNYVCDGCGEAKVFGIEELLLMGMISLI